MKSESLTFVSGLSLVIPLALMMLSKNVPSELYPLPVIVAIPALLGLGYAAPVAQCCFSFYGIPDCFAGRLRSRAIIRSFGDCNPPERPVVCRGLEIWIAVLGSRYNYSVLAINIAWLVGLWVMMARNGR